MKNKTQPFYRWFFIFGGLMFLFGLVSVSLILKRSTIGKYPSKITQAFSGAQHQLTVPGNRDVNLIRTGAYGIYYLDKLEDGNNFELEIPPAIDCVLISKSKDKVINAIPDYVKTNRYKVDDQTVGVLIMSITVDEPGLFTFSCGSRKELVGQEIQVALGPNHFWEFLRVTWMIAGPLFGGAGVFCGSLILTFVFLIAGGILKLLRLKKSDEHYQVIS